MGRARAIRTDLRALLAAAVTGCVLLAGCTRTPHPLTGQQAPDLQLDLLGGGTLNLADHRGKHIVLLDFWATWCGPCREYMPIIEKVAEEFRDQGVVLYAVNSQETPETVREYLKTFTIRSPIAMDTSVKASFAYQADFIPQTVVIDPEGRIQKVYAGIGRGIESELRSDLRRLIAGEDLAPPTAPNP